MKQSVARQVKGIALLLIIVFQSVYPTAAFAVADNVSQPEFEAFEEFNTTDMVDLATGDFNYNIPLLNIPSPEGGFQLPLTYHAGIELDEEASWVGLGWNINPGVMTRNPSMSPDDYKGEVVKTIVTNPGGTSGYFKTYPFYTKYYDSQKGKSGEISALGLVDIGTGSNKHVGIAPLGLNFKDGHASYNPVYMAQGLAAAAGIAATCASGIGMIAWTAGTSMIQGYADMQSAHANIGALGGNGVYVNIDTNKGDLFGIWGKKTEYSWYIDVDRSESQYGALNLGAVPPASWFFRGSNPDKIRGHNMDTTTNSDADGNGITDNYARHYEVSTSSSTDLKPKADMYYYEGTADYANSFQPFSISYDNYSIKGAGISGSIKPYRHDVGTLYNTVISSEFSVPFYGPQFKDPSYKVQFKYQGDYSNSYTFHNMNGSDLTKNAFPYTIDGTQQGGGFDFNVTFKNPKINLDYPTVVSMGNTFLHYPIPVDRVYTETRSDSTLYNDKLVHGRHIEWYSNFDMLNGGNSGLMNTPLGNIARTGKAPYQIGGFAITNESGFTYHYSVPVYTTKNIFCSKTRDDSSQPFTTNKITDDNSYAVAWLLTGITGPDFIDRPGTGNGIIDDNDWGYWVKFEYGKFASHYSWRRPYRGVSGDPNLSVSFQKGEKETYYLNRISTRTHSALFVKDRRLDGKGYYEDDGQDEMGNTIVQSPSESLMLSDIYVLENSDYNTLIGSVASGGFGLTTNNSSANGSYANNGDTYEYVMDVTDLSGTSGATAFLSQNQLQKIHFNYSYNQCGQTINSFATSAGNVPGYSAASGNSSGTALSGKLTLESVDLLGKNNIRIMPGYIFKYGNSSDVNYNSSSGSNPNYDPYRWDGNGMYKSGGVNQDPASPHNCEKKADQWCLTDVITPLSSTLHVNYERDDYAEINGYPINQSPLNFIVTSASASSNIVLIHGSHLGATTNLSDFISPSDHVVYAWWLPGGPTSFVSQVQSVSGNNTIVLANALPSNASTNNASVFVTTKKKYGGGLRVKNIITTDETNSYMTKYLYTKDGTDQGLSSGAASYEAQSEKTADFDFYKYYQHPYTSIIYSNVSVVSGDLNSTFNEKTRTAYHFVTPHHKMLSVGYDNYNDLNLGTEATGTSITAHYSAVWGNYSTVNATSAIGNLDTVKTYNKFNNLVSKTVFEYGDRAQNSTNNANMGYYTENTLLWEWIMYKIVQGNGSADEWMKMRFIQSYILNKPNFLRSVVTYKDRLMSKAEYTYDYTTGNRLVTKNFYGGIEKYENTIVPAYKLYPKMGSKVFNSANKNIMGAVAQNYSYAYDQYGQKQLLGASVQTWQNRQNYRDITTSGYSNATNPSVIFGPYQDVWLPYKTYTWKSAVQENGTIKSTDFVPFNWASTTQSSNWVQTSEATLYDRYSHVLESKDLHGNYNSSKYAFNQSYAVSGCPNAKYTDWCYSGAEDRNTINNFYEGEVDGGANQFSSSIYAHTGNYCSKVNQGGVAFKYKVNTPLSGKYRASVWIHQNGAPYAKLECVAYGTNNAPLSQQPTSWIGTSGSGYSNTSGATAEYIGAFYLFNLDIDPLQIPAGASYLVFQVTTVNPSISPYIYADDFRVHPLSTPITGSVFEQKTGRVLATLNGDNMATKFVYDAAGKLINTYKETKQGFKMISDIKYNYNR